MACLHFCSALACAHPIALPPRRTRTTISKPLRWLDSHQGLPRGFEVRQMRLALRQSRVHVAEAALERAAFEDRRRASGVIGEIYHRARLIHRAGDRNTQTRALAGGDVGDIFASGEKF